MWVVADLVDDYIAKMEDVLEIYEQPYEAEPRRNNVMHLLATRWFYGEWIYCGAQVSQSLTARRRRKTKAPPSLGYARSLFIALVVLVSAPPEVAFVAPGRSLLIRLLPALTENKQVSRVLRVDLPVAADRKGRVCRAEGELQKEPLHPRRVHVEDTGVSRRDHVGVSIFALHVHLLLRVDNRSIDAPFEAVRVIGNTTQLPVRLASAAVCFNAMKLPLRHQIGVELGDVKRPCRNPRGGANRVAHVSGAGRIAVEACFLVVVVVFDHDGISAAVRKHRRSRVPAEVEKGPHLAGGSIELDQVPASDVVSRVGAVQHVTVGQDGWRRGRLIDNVAVSEAVGCRVNPRMRAEVALPLFRNSLHRLNRNEYSAAVAKQVAHGGVPLARQVWIHRDHPSIPGAVVDAANRIDGSVRSYRRRHIETRAGNSARKCCTWRCIRSGRPWQRAVGESSDASGRRIGNQRGVAHHGRTIRRRNLHQPTADGCCHAGNRVDLRRVKPDRVVVYVPIVIGGKWSGYEGIRIDRSERVNSRHYFTGAAVQFIYCSAQTGNIDLAVRQQRMEYRLPASG